MKIKNKYDIYINDSINLVKIYWSNTSIIISFPSINQI